MRVMTDKTIDEAAKKPTPGVSDSEFADAIANPSSFTVDGLSQVNNSLYGLIAADKYMRQRSRKMRRRHPLSGMVTHLTPPGTCDR